MKKPFTLRLDTDLLKRVKIQAVKEGAPVNEIIESLVRDYLKEGEKRGSDTSLKRQKV